jgi:hypothetical protein
MPYVLRPYPRFPVSCSVTYESRFRDGCGTVFNLSTGGWRLCGNLSLLHSASDTPRDAGLLFHCTQHPLANTYKILYGFTCPL